MDFCCFLIFLLFLPGSSKPVTEKGLTNPSENNGKIHEPPTKKPRVGDSVSDDFQTVSNVPVCYFAEVRTTELETEARPQQSEVSPICSDTLIPFTDLINNRETKVTKFGAANEAALVLARGAGEFEYNWQDDNVVNLIAKRYICPTHRNELSLAWESTGNHIKKQGKKIACSFPKNTHTKFVETRLRDVRHIEAKAILLINGTLIHEGTPICELHQQDVRRTMTMFLNADTDKTTTYCDNYETPTSSRSQRVNYMESPDRTKNKVVPVTPPKDRFYCIPRSNSIQDAAGAHYIALMKELDIKPITSYFPWNHLNIRSKYRHVSAFKTIVSKIAEFAVGKSDADILMQAANTFSESEKSEKGQASENVYLTEIRNFYYAAETASERQQILAMVADLYPINTLEKYIPGLTIHRYYKAKKAAIRQKNNQTPYVLSPNKPRVKLAALDSFISFICSDLITTGLPFGNTKTKLPNGQIVEVPSAIRSFRASQIIEMYRRDLQNRGQTCEMSDSTMRRILEACPAKTRTALEAVDQFKANGIKAFNWMSMLLESLLSLNICDESTVKLYKSQLTEAEFFLKADYYNLLQPEHLSSDLCMNYALSDPKIEPFRSTKCYKKTEHRFHVPRAYIFDNLCDNIKSDIKELPKGAVKELELQKLEETIKESQMAINNWRNHVVRKRFSDDARSNIFKNLRNGDAIITIDYAQKWLPRKSTETQQDYFGKAGLSMHIMHAVYMTCGELQHHTVVHFLGYADQNYVAVTAILISGLTLLHEHGVENVILRSDNAGYYHCAALLMSMPKIGEKANVNLKRYSFSESQAGKSTADVETARLKNILRAYLNSGNDVVTEQDMFTAIHDAISRNVLYGVTAIVPTRIPVDRPAYQKQLQYMQYIGDVEYYEQDGRTIMKYWKHHQIGNGVERILTSEDTDDIPVEKFGGETRSTASIPFWRTAHMQIKPSTLSDVNCNDNIPTVNTNDESSNDVNCDPDEGELESTLLNNQVSSGSCNNNDGKTQKGLYRCDFEGCTGEFVTSREHEKHMLLGMHKFATEKETIGETSYKLYVDTMLGLRESHREFISATISTADVEVQSDNDIKPEGWALKKPPKRARFSETMRKFLKDHYVAQLVSNRNRVDTNLIQNLMRESENPFFTAEQRLSASQIASFYNRAAKELTILLQIARSQTPTEEQLGQSITNAFNANEEVEFNHDYRKNPSFPEQDEIIREALETTNDFVDVDRD